MQKWIVLSSMNKTFKHIFINTMKCFTTLIPHNSAIHYASVLANAVSICISRFLNKAYPK